MPPFTREQQGRQLLYDLSKGNLKEALKLMSQGALLELRDGTGATALSAAAYGGHTEMVQHLIECGVEIDQRDNGQNTPLMWAAYSGSLGSVEKLLIAGAKVDARNAAGETPADIAQAQGHVLIANALLDVQITHRKLVAEEWKNVAVDTRRDIQVSKPLQLKLGGRFFVLGI